MCVSIAYGCSIESLKKAGIELRVKEISYGTDQSADGVVPPPITYAGRTYIGISKKAITGDTASAQYLALLLIHEMSHVDDLKQNKKGTLAKAMYASDEKAVMNEIAAYDEISRKYPDFSDSFFDFLIDVWKLKNESGPLPKQRFLTLPLGPGGTPLNVSSGDLLNNYMPGLSFLDSLASLVHAIWHSAYGDPATDDTLVKSIENTTLGTSDSYKSWRANPAATAPPAPTPQQPAPQNPTPDQNNGNNHTHSHQSSDGGDSGNNFHPGPYNPHFQDGI